MSGWRKCQSRSWAATRLSMLRRRLLSGFGVRRLSIISNVASNCSATSRSEVSQAWWNATSTLSDKRRVCRGIPWLDPSRTETSSLSPTSLIVLPKLLSTVCLNPPHNRHRLNYNGLSRTMCRKILHIVWRRNEKILLHAGSYMLVRHWFQGGLPSAGSGAAQTRPCAGAKSGSRPAAVRWRRRRRRTLPPKIPGCWPGCTRSSGFRRS